jgi:hypothetical protein
MFSSCGKYSCVSWQIYSPSAGNTLTMADIFSFCGKYSCPGRHILLLWEILVHNAANESKMNALGSYLFHDVVNQT